MYNVLKKHSKKLLAVATALLMVAFLLPTQQRNQKDYVFARVAGKKVYASQLNNAQYQWHLLMSRVYEPETRQPIAAVVLGGDVIQQIEEHPEMFLLLRTEALNNGVYISEERLAEMRGRVAVADSGNDRNMQQAVNDALRSLLMVSESFARVATAARVSQPQREYELATRLQQMRMKVVPFAAANYMDQVQPPTPEEAKQHFEKYKDVDATTARPTKDNPFAFGYRFPDRAQVQYLMVPEEGVRKAVEASQSPDRWRIEATKYYLQHKSEFTTTTQPTGDALGLEKSKPVATTRPFAEVEKEATEAVIQPLVTKRQQEIINRLSGIIAADWSSYHAAKQGEQPASTLGVPYNSYEYLQKLSDAIEREFKVKLTIGATGGLVSRNDLNELEPIRQAMTQTQLPFAVYATMTEAERKQALSRRPDLPAALQPWQPSQVLRDFAGNAFMFRRTIIDPAHTPANYSEVASQVEQDVRLVKAYELAKQAAEAFAKDAKAQGFDAASLAARKAATDTAYFSIGSTTAMGVGLSETGSAQFTEGAMTLALAARAAGEEKPIVAVPVQKDGKVLVGQVEEIRSRLQGISLPMVTAELDRQMRGQVAMLMMADWFNYDNVVKRLQYVPEDAHQQQKAEDGETPAAPKPNQPLGM